MRALAGLLGGLIFGAGLAISGMINPLKVLAFLDVAGDWDPSLAFVMGGAIPVAAIGFAIGRRQRAPMLSTVFMRPLKSDFDARLLTGAALFGIGWGLTGYCPGPAIASIGHAAPASLVFVAAMLGGMGLYRLRLRAA
jgi:uncharacterized membrane protein YedE/YeeE